MFRIASISKTLTAIGVMQCRDNGLLDLDDAVNKHLKGLRVDQPPGAPDVTIRHLLTHTSGIGELPRVKDITSREMWGAGAPGCDPADVAALYGGVLRTEVAAGSKWAYANHGFAILGKLVEDVVGTPFADHMREHVLDPLGMANTDFVRNERVEDALATGHGWMFGRFRPGNDYDLPLLGAGAVMSSARDMARYARSLVRGGGNVLASTTLREMLSPQFAVDPRLATKMGLAFFLEQLGTHRAAGHTGNVPGFASSLLFAPDDGIGVVVLTNTGTTVGAPVLAGLVMRSVLGVPDKHHVAPRPALWSQLTGSFAPAPGFLTNFRAWQTTFGEVEVVVRHRRLVLRALSPIPALARGVELQPVDEDDPYLFAMQLHGLEIPVAFGADDAGHVDRIAIGAPANVAMYRRSRSRSSRRRLSIAATGAAAGIVLRRVRARRAHA